MAGVLAFTDFLKDFVVIPDIYWILYKLSQNYQLLTP